ncbi:MAG: energy transducer TonB [Rubrivivax sp.]|nr:energy transducer TonB [Pyrinomonadaceae bacterium]
MNHDCQATNDRLIDLLFGEVEAGREASLLEEVGRCDECMSRYRSMAETLHVFDAAAEAIIPAEEFWPGYEERFRKRMSQEIRQDLWQQAAFPFARGEYRLTFIEQEGLTRRLTRELRNVGHDAELTWPEFKRDPVGFTGRSVGAYTRAAWGFFSERNVALATVSSFVLLSVLLGSVYALDRFRASSVASVNPNENLVLLGMVEESEIPREQEKPDKGAAGTEVGKGGGSKAKYEKPAGGGGGGRNEAMPPSGGKLPTAQLVQPIVTANPKPPMPNPHLPTAVTMNVDPLLIKEDPRNIPYGLPNSTATTPSSGPGSGGGMGTGSGGGMGQGDGTGLGPGRGSNTGGGDTNLGGGGRGGGGGGDVDYNRPFQQKEVTRKALITFKPEPGFTEEARKNNVTGLVRLRAVLSSSGEVTSVSVIKGLPDGLTEKAISAAKQIKFRPAQKDGHTVSQYIVLEYNFNIY